MSNWKKINDYWFINLDHYDQIHLEAENKRWNIMGIIGDKDYRIDFYDNEEEARELFNKLTKGL